MRILLLSWEYPPVMVGGLGRHVHALSKALAAAGNHVTVVTRLAPGTESDEWCDGVRVVRVPEDPPLVPYSDTTLLPWAVAFNHALTRAALRVAAEDGVDVVHAHDWMVGYSAVTLREQLGAPLVTTIHATEAGRHQGWLPEEANRAIHSVECWLSDESDRLLVCSHYMRWEVNRLLKAPAERITVISNGVEPEKWQADPAAVAAARLRYGGTGPLIGFAGRLVYEKGVQDIIRALPALLASHPGLRLVVAGDGPYRSELVTAVRRRHLQHAVSFTGFLGPDLPATVAALDTLVVPSIYEPFGMVALEGAAAGVPVVAAATGGLKEVVETGRTGLTFRPGCPDALARAVGRMLDDPATARRMAGTASKVVLDRYGWEGIADRTVQLYRQAGMCTSSAPRLLGGRRIVVPDGNLLRPGVR